MGGYCFLAGWSVGIVLLISPAYYFIKNEHLSEWFYLACVTDASLILVAALAM